MISGVNLQHWIMTLITITEMDPEKRKDLIFQMQQILVDDAAVLIDGYYNSSMIYSKKVGSAHIHTADYYWLSTEITPAE